MAVNLNRSDLTLYRAPALEKGLDILELLADVPDGLTQNQIAQRLDRSVNEIYRMVDCLERRGYLAREGISGLYRLTLRLFELAHQQPPTRRLLTVAAPQMEQLARQVRQSAQLMVYYDARILCVAQVSSPEPMGFGIRLGAHFSFIEERTSARVIAAFQPPKLRVELARQMLSGRQSRAKIQRLLGRLERLHRRGYDVAPSVVVSGVTDVSYPIHDHGGVIAALTVPYLRLADSKVTIEQVRKALGETATAISRALGANGARQNREDAA